MYHNPEGLADCAYVLQRRWAILAPYHPRVTPEDRWLRIRNRGNKTLKNVWGAQKWLQYSRS